MPANEDSGLPNIVIHDNRARLFIDSNIILYHLMDDSGVKTQIAEKLLKSARYNISYQVIGEVCNNLKKKAGFTPDELIATVQELNRSFRIVPFSIETYVQAIKIGKDYSLSFWDSMIVAAAYLSDCAILFSEDMQDDLLIYDNLKIINPFH